MKQVVASAIFISGDREILLSRKRQSGLYCPPGGKVECREYIENALIREVREETGVKVVPASMDFINYFDSPEKVVFFYLVTSWIGQVRNREPEKHVEWGWHSEIPGLAECVIGLQYFKLWCWPKALELWRRRANDRSV